jgi:hypothetical protein
MTLSDRLIGRRTLLASLAAVILASSRAPAPAFQVYQGRKRVLVVLAPGESHHALARQRAMLNTQRTALSDRDIVINYVVGGTVTSDLGGGPGLSGAAIRTMLKASEGSFRVVLIGREGKPVLESSNPVPVLDIVAILDRAPIRSDQARQRALP